MTPSTSINLGLAMRLVGFTLQLLRKLDRMFLTHLALLVSSLFNFFLRIEE